MIHLSIQLIIILFFKSSIRSIIIPHSVVKIDDFSFSECKNLKSIEFHPDSNLEIIGREAFSSTAIEKIKIPSKVKFIGDFSFYLCENLQSIEFSSNSKLQK